MGVHLKGKRMQFLYRLSLYKTHAVVAVCEAAKSRFITEKIIPEKLISVVYNGIPSVNGRNEKNRTIRRRQQLKLPIIGPIVGSIGRLNVVKDYGTLIGAFKEILKTHPTANLVIAGDGPEREKLQELTASLGITEKVFLLGERSDVGELLEQFDLFVLTSLTEGFSVALVEAAWSGLPIVATDVGGNSEIIQDGITGYLTKPKNVYDIQTKIKKLLDDEQLRNQFGLVARKRAEANWTLELMLKRYQSVYQEWKPNQSNDERK
jgi:glycosyltransferase involved in cell wall biosynthesis